MVMKRTEQINCDKCIATLVANHSQSATSGEWNGKSLDSYFKSCRRNNPFRGITTIFTRDVGYHTSGWWKNPDYEQCYHLSVSFFDPATLEPCLADKNIVRQLVKGFFTKYAKWVWIEPPYSQYGQESGVFHYRLFCNDAWQPIKPRGEVYSRELTAAGWYSFSDVQDAIATTGKNPNR